MYKSGEQHPVEPSPGRGRTTNVLLDSDIDIRMPLLTQPTPPSSGRGEVDHPARHELAGAQQLSFGDDVRLYDGPTPNPLGTTAAGGSPINWRPTWGRVTNRTPFPLQMSPVHGAKQKVL
jgi:hypothetical protein